MNYDYPVWVAFFLTIGIATSLGGVAWLAVWLVSWCQERAGEEPEPEQEDRSVAEEFDRAILTGLLDDLPTLPPGEFRAPETEHTWIRQHKVDHYMIHVDDWGPDHDEMRFRWTVYDKRSRREQFLRPLENWDDVVGIGKPYYIANASTAEQALEDANAWCWEHPDEVMRRFP